MKNYALLACAIALTVASGTLPYNAIVECHREMSHVKIIRDKDTFICVRRSMTFSEKGYSVAKYERLFGNTRGDIFFEAIDQGDTKIDKRRSGEWIKILTQRGVIKPGTCQRVKTIELAPGIDFN
ncbi:hypothetical protein FPSE_10140 [Fusarium pseudograminearum CS3096]|uniref:Uncharacterized protein n=1 Tax=Fusarium pseudograminearum (strain CS3096) TaxID=1028729 RepID=K3UDU1_FUSPC|nr:hypothetical protein FPSE_10140 [Fusarium pseudograminearum CS3096]EKJ69726.1 hypothetical protein FPSE_10140 [Fusarium pseudograminearum CS3096]